MTVDWSRDGKRLSSGGLDKQVGEGPREEERRGETGDGSMVREGRCV